MSDFNTEGKEDLVAIIEMIDSKHKTRFIVEQNVTTDGESEQVVYKLKKRTVRCFIKKVKFLTVTNDEYVLNALENVINFRDLPQITEFLRIQYSEREGFVTDSSDITT